MNGILYIVGTPIGNLSDFSPRAAQTLENVDFIAAEDTRVTLKLLNHFGIKKEMVSYYEHNKRERGEIICERITRGENCALVTDAGMPAVSDPGEDLICLCHETGIKVVSVPGPTAFATALALSGMETGRFTFEGFLSVSKKSRFEHLESIKDEKRTMIFYEAPHKLANTLKDLYNALGCRELAIVREITKIHEEVINTNLKDASQKYANGGLKGEIVLVVAGKKDTQPEISMEQAVLMAESLVSGGMSINNAAKEIAAQTTYKKSDIYKELL
ncbi:MAG: 16S rRNA (cytidine(1402)-2'-O)-methyltransferase [Clostridiales bacterium]|nr:16S rRNA (cytidine(1402)-2'-O)-methyltransferase [Clostridiales bacterium]